MTKAKQKKQKIKQKKIPIHGSQGWYSDERKKLLAK